MKAGRPPLLTPNVEWKLMIPEPLALQVEMLCFDPLRGKAKHGARSAYLVRLIREDLAKRGILAGGENIA